MREELDRGLFAAVIAVAAGLELSSTLKRIVQSAADLVDARYGALGVLDADGKVVDFVHVGMSIEDAESLGDTPQGRGILGLLIDHPVPLRLEDLSSHPASVGFPDGHPPMKSFLGVPVRVRGEVFGNLYLTEKRSGANFTADDERTVMALAAAAAVAIENTRLHEKSSNLAVFEDRDRIARDLHDLVIQRLFATGMMLQGVSRVDGVPDEALSRVSRAVDDLDETIKEIRHTIFALHETLTGPDSSARGRILTETAQASAMLGFDPSVRFVGPLDSMLDQLSTDQILATIREALANVAKHAEATKVDVIVQMDGSEAIVMVTDDGIGIDESGPAHQSGITNMTSRAQDRNGSCAIMRMGEDGGTRLVWRILV
jgi:signal transduction histidine kinase